MISCAAQPAAGVLHHREGLGQDFVENVLLDLEGFAPFGLRLIAAQFGLELAGLGGELVIAALFAGVFDARFEVGGPGPQLLFGERLAFLFVRVDAADQRLEFLQLAIVLRSKNCFENPRHDSSFKSALRYGNAAKASKTLAE